MLLNFLSSERWQVQANLIDKWILPSTLVTSNRDYIVILRQYADLVKQLNDTIMNSVIMEKFYASLLVSKENRDSAKTINEMLAFLPTYMADRLFEKFIKIGRAHV